MARLDEARMLNPGLLRHQITWRSNEITGQDPYGQDYQNWKLVGTVKAQVRAAEGRELEALQQRWAEARYVIRQHYMPGMIQAQRGEWTVDGVVRFLDVIDVQDIAGTHRSQTVIAKEWKP